MDRRVFFLGLLLLIAVGVLYPSVAMSKPARAKMLEANQKPTPPSITKNPNKMIESRRPQGGSHRSMKPIDRVKDVFRVGEAGNVMTVELSTTGYDTDGSVISGWSDDQRARLNDFIGKMYPIIESVYGSPSSSYTVTLVMDLWWSDSAVFYNSTDEIYMDEIHYQLLTHELIHAFRNDVTISSDSNWDYDDTLSGFEEGFAQAVSYECMNRYIEAYPNDPYVNTNVIWLPDYGWEYDYQNLKQLRTTDFWSDTDGTGIVWRRYEMAAVAMIKINIESPGFYKAFNEEYYARINVDETWRPTRETIIEIIETLVPTIEKFDARTWIDKQHIFYSQIVTGKKVFHILQGYPSHEFWMFQRAYFLETKDCGSEWACWDDESWSWVYHHNQNGTSGKGTLYNQFDKLVWEGALLMEPTSNPNDVGGFWGFGSDELNFTISDTLEPWPGGDASDFVFNLTEPGLYKFVAESNEATSTIYMLMGSQLVDNYHGVAGAIKGRPNGTIYLNHESFPDEVGIPVIDGVFFGEREWIAVFNNKTRYYDSVPGKVTVTFENADTGLVYETQRNIGYGSWNGTQVFLFDFAGIEATPAPTLSEWGMITLTLTLIYFGVGKIDKQSGLT